MTRVRGRTASVVGVLTVAAVLSMAGCGGQEEGAGVRVTPSASNAPSVEGGVSTPAAIDPCPASGEPVGRGDGLPELDLACLGPGPSVQMAGLTGRPVVVNVWASWCGPCRDELPMMQQAADTGAVAVLGVDAEDTSEAAAALLADLGVTFPSVFDPRNEFGRELGVVTKPTTVLVSEEGEIQYVQPGAFASYADLQDAVDRYLDVELP